MSIERHTVVGASSRPGSRAVVRVFSAIAALILGASLAACSSVFSGSDSGVVSDAATSPMDGSFDLAATEASSGEISREASTIASQRSIISQGSISLSVENAHTSAEDVARIVDELGGYVESQNVSGESSDTQGASLTIRVPAAAFDVTFAELRGLGTVLDESRSAQDVTAQHVDLQARVEALQASVDRLTELMSGAATTGELIEAESALAERQAELDGLNAQLQALENQVDEATIWVTLTVKTALPGGPSNFWEGLKAGIASLVTAASGGLVLLGVLLPWLVLLGVIILVIVALVKAGQRRRVRNAPPPAPPVPSTTQTPLTTQAPPAPPTPPAPQG